MNKNLALPLPTSPETARRIATTIGYYIAFIALGLFAASLGPTLPGLAAHTQTQLSQISFLFMAHSSGYLLGAFQGGRLYDRVAGHPLMAAALVMMAVMLALIPLIPLLWLLTAVVFVAGMAGGALDVGANTLIVWVFRRAVGPFMNGLHFCFGVGAALSPIIIAEAVARSNDITQAYWILAVLMLPAALWLARLPSPAAQQAAADDPNVRVNNRLVFLIALLLFLYVGAEVSFGGWVFTYAATLGLANATTAAYLTSLFWGALTVGRLLGIPIAARFSPRVVLCSDLVGCLASVGAILLWSNSAAVLWICTFGVGFFMASVFPATISLAERCMTVTGRVTGWAFGGASAGGIILPWLIGQLFESVGPRATMFTISIDLVLTLGVFAVLIFHADKAIDA